VKNPVPFPQGRGSPSHLVSGWLGFFTWKEGSQGMKVTTYLHPVPKLTMIAAINQLSRMPSWHAQGQLNKSIMHIPRNMTMLYATYPPMKMEQTECSETLAYKIQTLGNYPLESIQHSVHGESLKSSMTMLCSTLLICWYWFNTVITCWETFLKY